MSLVIALVPGLVFGIEALLVLAALRWLGESVPRWVSAVGFGLVFVLLGPVLVGGKVCLPLDLLGDVTPFRQLPRTERPANPLQWELLTEQAPALAGVRGALRKGEWPLWNPSVGAGESLLGRPAAQFLQPLQGAALALPLERALGVVAGLKLFLAFALTFRFLRRLALGNPAAVVGALAFGASSFVIQWLGWPAATVAAWFPGLLLAVDRAVVPTARRVDFVLLGGVVFAVLTAGDDDAGRAALAVAGAFAFLRLAELRAPERAGSLLSVLLASVVALALASPVVFARLEVEAESTTRAQFDAFVARRGETDPLGLWSFDTADERHDRGGELGRQMLPSLAPDALGNNGVGAYWGAANVNEDGGGFAGTAVLLLALVGVGLPGRGPCPREARFFAVVLLAAVALVARPPILVEVADAFASPSLHRHGLLVAAFSLATLGAVTYERIRREGLARPVVLVTTALVLGGFLVWAHQAYPPPLEALALAGLRHRTLGLQLATLTCVTGALLLSRRHPAGLGLVPFGVALELVLLGQPVNRPGRQDQYFPTPPAVAFLTQRVAPEDRVVGLGEAAPPETLGIYGLRDVRVAGTRHPEFYTRLITPLKPPRQNRFDRFARADHPLLDLLGVRYVLAAPGTALPPGSTMVFEDASGVVFERSKRQGLVFLPRAVDLWNRRSGSWERWTRANGDFEAKSLVRDIPGGGDTWRARRPARATVEVTEVLPTRVTARVETGEPRLVATSIFADPGWRALVGGRAVPTTVVNGPLLALWLPAGRHDLEIMYRPRTFVVGMALAALGLTLAAAYLAAPRRLSQ
jgi:hypothetical protein